MVKNLMQSNHKVPIEIKGRCMDCYVRGPKTQLYRKRYR